MKKKHTVEKTNIFKEKDCKKKEVKEHGQGIEDNYISRLGYYYQD